MPRQRTSHQRTIDLVQLITSIAVVIGLGLIVWELQLNQRLVRTQLSSEHFSEQMANWRARLGDNPAQVIAKGYSNPEELTDEEMINIQADTELLYQMVIRMRMINELGGFGIPWEAYAREQFRHILGTPFGRFGYEVTYQSALPEDESMIMRDILENHEYVLCETLNRDFRKWLADEGATGSG